MSAKSLVNSTNVPKILKAIDDAGYCRRPAETHALVGLLTQREGARAMVIQGEPGAGKTAYAEFIAEGLKAQFNDVTLVRYQFHSWSSPDEIYHTVNVKAAVTADGANVTLPGFLMQIAKASQKGVVVALGDEFDKAPERVEHLFLDVLQSGYLPDGEGGVIQINMNNVIWVFTSNDERDLGDAFMRRVRRVYMSRLNATIVDSLVEKWTQYPLHLCRLGRLIAHEIAQQEDTYASPQEVRRLLDELVNLTDVGVLNSAEETVEVVAAWSAKNALAGRKIIGEHAPKTDWKKYVTQQEWQMHRNNRLNERTLQQRAQSRMQSDPLATKKMADVIAILFGAVKKHVNHVRRQNGQEKLSRN